MRWIFWPYLSSSIAMATFFSHRMSHTNHSSDVATGANREEDDRKQQKDRGAGCFLKTLREQTTWDFNCVSYLMETL